MSMGFVKSAYIKENFGGNKMFKKLKDKKDFTLVELIVVLVILAILAALLVPALTGYIDKANQEKAIAECRSVVVAAQTTASEYYGLSKQFDATTEGQNYTYNALAQVQTLSEATSKWTYAIVVDYAGTSVPKGTVTSVKFWDGKAYVEYTKNSKEAGTYSEVKTSNKTGLDEGIANSTINGSVGTAPTT